jgi:hypothetical protein
MKSNYEATPKRYEVIRFKNGQEIIGMVRERDSGGWIPQRGIEVWAPMSVSLSSMPDNKETIANFMPFTALAEEAVLFFKEEDILFRAIMNPEYIKLYDAAATEWMKILEKRMLNPISQQTGQKRVREYLDKTARSLAEEYLLNDDTVDDIQSKSKRFEDRVLTDDDKIH